MRTLTRLKSDIRAQEMALNLQRREIAGRYQDVQTRFHRQLTSPTALMTSFTAGLVVGALVRSPRQHRRSDVRSARQRIGPWISLARAIGGPALVYLLRTKLAQLIGMPRL